MSKTVRVAASKIIDGHKVVVTEKIFKKSEDMWPDLGALQIHVNKVVAGMPELYPGFKLDKQIKKVYLKSGGSGTATYVHIRQGEPVLVYSEDHIDDITWEYPLLETRFIAGPNGEYVSQAESVAR